MAEDWASVAGLGLRLRRSGVSLVTGRGKGECQSR